MRRRRMRRVKLVPVGILQRPRLNGRSLAARGPGHQDQVVVAFIGGDASGVAPKRLNGWRMGRLEVRPVAAVPRPRVAEVGLAVFIFAPGDIPRTPRTPLS